MKKPTIKIPTLTSLYELTSKDYSAGCELLGEAFREDPIWCRILEDQPEKFPLIFGVPLKYTLKYGKVYAPTSQLDGIAAWLGSPYPDMTFWRMLRSGSIIPAMKLGSKIGGKISKVFKIIEEDRKSLMKTPYVYLYVIGVHPSKQGQGMGTFLVKSMLEALPPDIPVYLETETEIDVKFYKKLGFEVVKEITVPVLDLPMWEMLYQNK